MPNGENINIFPEVPGTVTQVKVAEGAKVRKGQPLVVLDYSVQAATVAQQKAQAAAALAMLRELRAEPRKEVLAVNKAQVLAAAANLKTTHDTLNKLERSFKLDPHSVSRDQLDTARNSVKSLKPIWGLLRDSMT